jgi:hypothetical protein
VDDVNHLRCEIIRGTAKRPCGIRAVLCESKVCDFDVTIETEEDVFGLEVTINNV